MGYHWMENPEAHLLYDLFIFKKDSARSVKVILVRNRMDPDIFYDKKYHTEAEELRSLPFPPHVIREIWLKGAGKSAMGRKL